MAIINFFDDVFAEASKKIEINKCKKLKTIVNKYIEEKDSVLTSYEVYDIETGETTYVAQEPSEYKCVCVVNGEEADLDYVVQDKDIVSVILIPQSAQQWINYAGGGALIIGGILLAVLTEGTAATIGGYMITAGIGMIIGQGASDIAGLFNTTDTSSTKKDTLKEAEDIYGINGGNNNNITDHRYPVVIGKHLITPYIVGSWYNETNVKNVKGEDDGQYIRQLYCAGYGPLRLTDFKLGSIMLAYNRTSDDVERESVIHGKLSGYTEDDTGDILKKWKNNDVEIEILQAGDFSPSSRYGEIYPQTVEQINPNANLLNLQDGEIIGLASRSYLNTAIPNGYKANSVRFSRGCPLKLEVELDFPQGLYAYRTQTSTQEIKYYNLPISIAVQWRFVKNGQASSDANDPEGWHDFDSISFTDGTKLEPTVYTFHRKTRQYKSNKGIVPYVFFEGEYAEDTVTSFFRNDKWLKNRGKAFNINCSSLANGTEETFTSLPEDTYYIKAKVGRNVNYYSWFHNNGFKTTLISENYVNIPLSQEGLNALTTIENGKRVLIADNFTMPSTSYFEKAPYIVVNWGLFGNLFGIIEVGEYPYEPKSVTACLSTRKVAQDDYYKIYGKSSDFSNTDIKNKIIGSFTSLLDCELIEESSLAAYKNEYDSVSPITSSPISKQNINVNERRYVATKEFTKEEVDQLINYYSEDLSDNDCVEVRVLRLTPCYLNEYVYKNVKININGNEVSIPDHNIEDDYSALTYNDLCKWTALRTFSFDKEKYREAMTLYHNDLNRYKKIYGISTEPDPSDFPLRPFSESDSNKFTYIALKLKADAAETAGRTLNQLTCIASNFAPKYDLTQKMWFPEDIKKKYRYFRKYYNENLDETVIDDLTEEQYEASLQQKRGLFYMIARSSTTNTVSTSDMSYYLSESDEEFIPYTELENAYFLLNGIEYKPTISITNLKNGTPCEITEGVELSYKPYEDANRNTIDAYGLDFTNAWLNKNISVYEKHNEYNNSEFYKSLKGTNYTDLIKQELFANGNNISKSNANYFALAGRNLVSQSDLIAAGWTEADSDKYIYPQAYDSVQFKNKTTTLESYFIVTPILADGTILTPTQLYNLTKDIYVTGKDNYGILLKRGNVSTKASSIQTWLNSEKSSYVNIINKIEEKYYSNDIDEKYSLYNLSNVPTGELTNDLVKNFATNTLELPSTVKVENVRYELNSFGLITPSQQVRYQLPASVEEKYITSNSASQALYALFGAHNGIESKTYDDVNLKSFTDSFIYNEDVTDGTKIGFNDPDTYGDGLEHFKFEANGVITSEKKLESLLEQLLLTCRSYVKRDEQNRYQVLIGKPVDYPTGVLNQQIIVSKSNSRAFGDEISGFVGSFIDESDNYTQNTLYIMNDGENYKNPTHELEQYSVEFVTNKKQFYSLGKFNLCCKLYQKESYNITVGRIGYTVNIGDVFLFQDPSILVGQTAGGRIHKLITNENTNELLGFELKEPIEYPEQEDFGCTIVQPKKYGSSRCVTLPLCSSTITDGEGNTYTQTIGNTNIIYFKNPINMDTSVFVDNDNISVLVVPEQGNLIAFGSLTSMTEKVMIMGIKPKEKDLFDLTVTPYNPQIYNMGTRFPAFTNNMTQPSREDMIVPFTNSASLSVMTESINNSEKNTISTAVEQAVEQSTNSTVTPIDLTSVSGVAEKDYIQLTANISNESTINSIQKVTWTITRKDGTTKTVVTNSNNGYYYFDRSVDGYPSRADLADWTVSAKYTNIYGNECAHSTSASITVSNSYLTWIPTACTATVTPNQNGLEIKINHITSGFYGTPSYTIVVNGKTFTTYEKNFTYAFVRTGTGADGYPEASDFTDNNYTVQIYANNEAYTGTNGTLTTVLGSSFVTTNYGTWIPPALASSRFTAVLGKNGITISDNVEELSETQYYGQPYTLVYEYSLDGTTNWQTINDKNLVFSPNPHQESAYYNAAKVRVTRKSTANKSSTVTMKAVDRSSYGTWTTPSVVSVSAKADMTGISLFLDTTLTNTQEYYAAPFTTHVEVSKDNGATWEEIGGTRYDFIRTGNNKEFPEISDLATWKFKSYYTSSIDDGQGSSKGTETLCNFINTTGYGTWNVQTPVISKRVSGRNVTLTFGQPVRADGKTLYGDIRYKVSIKRYDDTTYYKPAISLDPYASEDNYKDTTESYLNSGDMFQQILPLEGQNKTEPLPIDTSYTYYVCCYNATSEGNDSNGTTEQVIAMATSAKDIVAAAITTNKLADDCVTYDKLHANVVTSEKGTFKDLASENLVLGKVSGDSIISNSNNFWDLESGEFRVGDNNQYLHIVKNPITQEFIVEFKVGNFEVSASASALTGATYIYDENDNTRRLFLSHQGIEFEKFNSSTNTWESLGRCKQDDLGNFYIGNSNFENFNMAYPLPDSSAKVYHFEGDTLDQNNLNSKNIVTSNGSYISTSLIQGTAYSGELKIPVTTDDIAFLSRSEIIIGGKTITKTNNGIVAEDNFAGLFNNNANTSWGLTASQINAKLAKYKED